MVDDDILADFENRTKPKTDGEFNSRLEQAKNAYKEKFGKDLPITSKIRTKEQQQDLYNRWKKGEKGIYMPLNPADYPNQKIFHTDAADISTEVPETFLNQYGLHRPLGKNDPVHTILNPNFKSSNFTNVSNTSEDLLNQFEQDTQQHEQYLKNEGLYQPKNEWKPGFYNPNLVRQGEAARQAGGGNLQPIVENTAKALGGMSWEDWKKNALTANLLKYGVGSMPIVGDEQMREEGRQKLEEVGKGLYSAVRHPRDTFTALSNLKPEEAIPEMIKGGIYDAPLGMATKPILEGAKFVTNPVTGAISKVATPVVESAAEKFGNLQKAFQKLKPPTKAEVTLEGANYRPDLDTQMVGGGAALTSNAEAVKNALYQSNPELIADLIRQSGVKSFDDLPFNKLPLDVIERHNKFSKFDMTPTEGEALQDIKKMSIETNERTKDDLIRARLEERDPKLIAGFNKIRETVAPDVYESNPAKLANTALEKLKQNYEARTAHEATLYKRLEEANGGDFPINVGELDKNIISSLKSKKSFRDVESHPMYQELKDQLATGKMSFDDFEHFRTRLATAMRSAKDGNVRFGLGIIRDELENMPIPENLSHLKPLADEARQAFREHKQLQKDLPAYKAAIDDTRTPEEILKGDLHPASNEFINKFYGPNTKQVELNRLLNEIGINSVEHQGLNAATIDKIKRASGIKGEFGNETGKISQASLSDQLNKSSPNTYGNNLSTMFRQEHIKDLKDLSDVANMTEHVKGGHSVNVSNTALENERLARQQLAENLALNLGEGVVNLKTGGLGGTVVRKLYDIRKGKAIQEAAEKEARLKSEKRISPSAGISLEDIMNTGKK